MQIPCCIHLSGNDTDGWKIEFPVPSQGTTHHIKCDSFDEAVDSITKLSKKDGIDLSNYKLVVNL